MLNEIEENMNRKLNSIRTAIYEQNEDTNKLTQLLKKRNDSDILELKNTLSELKNSLKGFNSTLKQTE